MTSSEFTIGAVYTPDGGKTSILVAAPDEHQLRAAWTLVARIPFSIRKCFRIDAITGSNLPGASFEGCDWSLSNTAIARQLGVDRKTVAKARP